jgi:ornithine cyclodeaminase
MTRIITRTEIEAALLKINLIEAMEQAFTAYSAGKAVIPPVGELLFKSPPGEAHIKYGYLLGDDVFVIKVATGFFDNPKLDLPSSSGLILVFSQVTGQPLSILLDEGELTNLRTAAAGAVAAKHLARSDARRVAVLGAGIQARLQVEMLGPVIQGRDLTLWARRPKAVASLERDLGQRGWHVSIANSPRQAAADADIIITTTAASTPLLNFDDIRPGTHITAVGSDTPDKQELDSSIIAGADIVVADSIPQCLERGEIHHAIAAGGVRRDQLLELGNVIRGQAPGRVRPEQVTVVDLTGVAVQDIAIAKAVLRVIEDD